MGCSVFFLLNSELRAFDSRIVIILLFNCAAFFSLTFRLHICHSAKMSAINELNKDVARNKGKKTNQRNLFGFSNGFYFHLNKMTNNHIRNVCVCRTSSFRLFCTTMFVCVIRSKWFCFFFQQEKHVLNRLIDIYILKIHLHAHQNLSLSLYTTLKKINETSADFFLCNFFFQLRILSNWWQSHICIPMCGSPYFVRGLFQLCHLHIA